MEAVDTLAALILAFTYEQDKYIIKKRFILISLVSQYLVLH